MVIEVDTRKLKAYAGMEKDVARSLGRINDSLESCRRGLKDSLSSSATEAIDRAVSTAGIALGSIGSRIGKLSEALESAAGIYENTEKDISGNKPGR